MVLNVRNGRFGMLLEEPECADSILAAVRAADHFRSFADHAGQWIRPDIFVEFEDHQVIHLRAHGLGWMTDDRCVVFGEGIL